MLNSTEVLICQAFLDSYFGHDEFVLVNNVLKEYGNMKDSVEKYCRDFNIFIRQCCRIARR